MYVISMFAEGELKYWHGGEIFGPHLDEAALFRTFTDADNTIEILRPPGENHDGKPELKVLEYPGEH
ncbi:MAG: hypothetical protein AB7K67_12030 [Hyphomicrobiaceae bacterium]